MPGILERIRTAPVQAALDGPVSEIFPSLYWWMQVRGSAPPVKPPVRKTSVVPLSTKSPSAFTLESLYLAPNSCRKTALSAAAAEAAVISIKRNGTKRGIGVLLIAPSPSLTLLSTDDSGLYKNVSGGCLWTWLAPISRPVRRSWRSEPIAPICHPPANAENWNGCTQRPPNRQHEFGN